MRQWGTCSGTAPAEHRGPARAFIDASNVTIDVSNGEVTIQDAVDVRQQKYAIEDLVADVAGVTEIHNQLSLRSREIEDRSSGL